MSAASDDFSMVESLETSPPFFTLLLPHFDREAAMTASLYTDLIYKTEASGGKIERLVSHEMIDR